MIINCKNDDLSIPIHDYEVNVVHFENQRWYQLWNEPLLRLVKQVKNEIELEIEIKSEDGKSLKSSQILYIGSMNQDIVTQRLFLKLVHGKVAEAIEKDSALFSTHEEINRLLYQLFHYKNFDDVLKDYELEFSVEQFSLLRLIESIPLDLHSKVDENWHTHSRNIKETLITLHLEMNPDCNLVILDYPEHRMSKYEKQKFIKFLHDLSVTVLVVTSDYHFMKSVNKLEHLQIVDNLGERYPISEVIREQQLFYSKESNALEKTIAEILGIISFYSTEEQKAISSVLKQL